MKIFPSNKRAIKTKLSQDEIHKRILSLINEDPYQGYWKEDEYHLNKVPRRVLGALSMASVSICDYKLKIIVKKNELSINAETLVTKQVENITRIVYFVLLILQVLAILSAYSNKDFNFKIFSPLLIIMISFIAIKISLWYNAETFLSDLKLFLK